ncbi:MAG: hypothetical protein ACD_21C00147G0006 [uncultured bacterium]|nr:MAG: hypothetical protein ACD_21C00147G0006 [uncultured bacterium]
MALQDRLNNAKQSLSDTRTRVVIIILMVIVIVTLVVSYVKFKRSQKPAAGLQSEVTEAPDITSIPGLGQPTREYAKLQEQQNLELAAEAAKKRTAAIPTVVRTTYLDVGVSSDLSEKSGATSVAGCSVEDLTRARVAGVVSSELRCRGCSLASLKAAGFTSGELRSAGFGAQELKAIGFNAQELRSAGFGAKELKAAGFSAKELMNSGVPIGALKDAGFSAVDLRAAGFGEEAINAVGFGSENLSTTGKCSIQKLQGARGKGISPDELKKMSCSAAILKTAGFTAAELKAAGFSSKKMKDAGFSALDLKAAGFNAKDLREAGFDAKELKNSGFGAVELKNSGFSAGELRDTGLGAQELKDAGFGAEDLKNAGFSAAALKDGGFSSDELMAAGYTQGDLMRAGAEVTAMAAETVVAPEVSTCSVESLKASRNAKISTAKLKSLGCSIEALKEAGFDSKELKEAGLITDELPMASSENVSVALGFSKEQEKLGRLSEEQLQNMTTPELDDFMNQQQALMMQQANDLFAAWAPIPSQQYVQGEAVSLSSSAQERIASSSGSAAMMQKNVDIYKAGTIIFAILNAEVNSDENSPVMATIIQGPLKDSKLLGNFQRVDKKVLLQFSVLSVPKLTTSISINAVAVDPNTSQTALASQVDNHYMLRYGTLLATSFMSGLGEAIQNTGGDTTATAAGFLSTTPKLDIKDKMLVAAGNMAQQFGTAMAPTINKPPTIKVHAGASIGLLLMSDLSVPKS